MSIRRAQASDARAIATVHVRSWQSAYHGRALMEAALATLGQAAYAEAALWVLDTNQRARRFYEAGGWHSDGTLKQEPWPDAGFTLSEVRYRRPLAG